MLVEIFAKLFVYELLDEAFDVAVKFAFGLAFELGLRKLYGDDLRDQSFAHVVTVDRDFVLLLFQHAERTGVVIDRTRQRRTGSPKDGSPVYGVDGGVGEREKYFGGVAVVVLQRDLHFHLVALSFNENWRIVQHAFAFVQVLDEFRDAAGVAKFSFLAAAFVVQRDFEAFVQKRQFAQTLCERVIGICVRREDRGVGVKP